MVIKTKSRNTSIKTPLGICILAGAATGTLVAMITGINAPAVHADADLSKPAAIVSPVPQAAGPRPAFLAAKAPAPETEGKKRLQIIRGLASWYGGVFNGRKTASGEG